MILIMH